MVLTGQSPDGTIGIVVSTLDGVTPVADAQAAGRTTMQVYDLFEFARVEVRIGQNVLHDVCNDAIDPDAFSIDEVWEGRGAPTLTLEVVPEADELGTASATIEGLVLIREHSDGGVSVLETFSLENVNVGWLPG